MAEYKVLIADSRYKSYEEEKAVLEEIDVEIIFESSDSEDKIADTASDVDGLIVNLAPITAKIISAMKKCKCISRYGAGYDNVDTDALSLVMKHSPDGGEGLIWKRTEKQDQPPAEIGLDPDLVAQLDETPVIGISATLGEIDEVWSKKYNG